MNKGVLSRMSKELPRISTKITVKEWADHTNRHFIERKWIINVLKYVSFISSQWNAHQNTRRYHFMPFIPFHTLSKTKKLHHINDRCLRMAILLSLRAAGILRDGWNSWVVVYGHRWVRVKCSKQKLFYVFKMESDLLLGIRHLTKLLERLKEHLTVVIPPHPPQEYREWSPFGTYYLWDNPWSYDGGIHPCFLCNCLPHTGSWENGMGTFCTRIKEDRSGRLPFPLSISFLPPFPSPHFLLSLFPRSLSFFPPSFLRYNSHTTKVMLPKCTVQKILNVFIRLYDDYHLILEHSHFPQKKPVAVTPHSPPCCPGNHSPTFGPCGCLFWTLHTRGIIQCVVFGGWVLHLA